MNVRRRLGNHGEIIAARFLEAKGYKVLAHQFKTREGEIDLIVERDDEIVFVEVKTRKNFNFGFPEESINKSKLNRMVLAGQTYLEQKQTPSRQFRLDVVAVILLPNKPEEIEHLEGVDIESLQW